MAAQGGWKSRKNLSLAINFLALLGIWKATPLLMNLMLEFCGSERKSNGLEGPAESLKIPSAQSRKQSLGQSKNYLPWSLTKSIDRWKCNIFESDFIFSQKAFSKLSEEAGKILCQLNQDNSILFPLQWTLIKLPIQGKGSISLLYLWKRIILFVFPLWGKVLLFSGLWPTATPHV